MKSRVKRQGLGKRVINNSAQFVADKNLYVTSTSYYGEGEGSRCLCDVLACSQGVRSVKFFIRGGVSCVKKYFF